MPLTDRTRSLIELTERRLLADTKKTVLDRIEARQREAGLLDAVPGESPVAAPAPVPVAATPAPTTTIVPPQMRDLAEGPVWGRPIGDVAKSYSLPVEAGRQLVGGMTDVGGAVGHGLQAAGRFVEEAGGKSDTNLVTGTEAMKIPGLGRILKPVAERLKATGKEVGDYWGDAGEQFKQSADIQGSVVKKPELLVNPKWWASNISRMTPGLAASLLVSYATGGGSILAGAGKPVARSIGGLLGGTAGGLMEGKGTEREGIRRGMSEDEAIDAGMKMTAASGILNAISLDSALNPSARKWLARFLISGSTEAVTEYGEEPAEGIILGEDWATFKKRLIDGVNVLGPAFFTGGPAAVLAGGNAEQTPPPAPPQTGPAAESARAFMRHWANQAADEKNLAEVAEQARQVNQSPQGAEGLRSMLMREEERGIQEARRARRNADIEASNQLADEAIRAREATPEDMAEYGKTRDEGLANQRQAKRLVNETITGERREALKTLRNDVYDAMRSGEIEFEELPALAESYRRDGLNPEADLIEEIFTKPRMVRQEETGRVADETVPAPESQQNRALTPAEETGRVEEETSAPTDIYTGTPAEVLEEISVPGKNTQGVSKNTQDVSKNTHIAPESFGLTTKQGEFIAARVAELGPEKASTFYSDGSPVSQYAHALIQTQTAVTPKSEPNVPNMGVVDTKSPKNGTTVVSQKTPVSETQAAELVADETKQSLPSSAPKAKPSLEIDNRVFDAGTLREVNGEPVAQGRLGVNKGKWGTVRGQVFADTPEEAIEEQRRVYDERARGEAEANRKLDAADRIASGTYTDGDLAAVSNTNTLEVVGRNGADGVLVAIGLRPSDAERVRKSTPPARISGEGHRVYNARDLVENARKQKLIGKRPPKAESVVNGKRVDTETGEELKNKQEVATGAKKGVLTRENVSTMFKGRQVDDNGDGSFSVHVGKKTITVAGVDHITPDEKAVKKGYGEKFSVDRDTGSIIGEDEGGEQIVLHVRGSKRGDTIRVTKHGDQWTLAHESEHWLEDAGILTKAEVSALTFAARKKTANVANMSDSERRAVFVEDALKNRAIARQYKIDRIIQKIMDWLDTIVNLARPTARGAVRGMESGKYLDRAAKKFTATGRTSQPQYSAFDDFERAYRQAFKQMMKYKPSEVGSQVWAEKMAQMEDEHPDWVEKIEGKEQYSVRASGYGRAAKMFDQQSQDGMNDATRYSLKEDTLASAEEQGYLAGNTADTGRNISRWSGLDRELRAFLKKNPVGHTRPNAHEIDRILKKKPGLVSKIREMEKTCGVKVLNAEGRLIKSPIEERMKSPSDPLYGGFYRSLTQTYLDQMPIDEKEAFRQGVVRYIEKAYQDGGVKGELGISLSQISKGDFIMAPAVRSADKTVAAINLNGLCPMFIVGANGCWLDACYLTGMGRGGNGVNLYQTALYIGEILQLSDESIAQMNKVGGLRMNGTGDSNFDDLSQWRDIFRHAEMRGLKLKIITKQDDTFKIVDALQKGDDRGAANTARGVIVQPSLDPYWVPVDTDFQKGSGAVAFQIDRMLTERGNSPEALEAAAQIYREVFHRDARVIDGKLYRKYGFSYDQIKELAKKYSKVRIQPRTVVGTPREIAETALNTPEVLQTWMHASLRTGLYSDIEGRILGEKEAGNYTARISVKKDESGEWRILAQAKKGTPTTKERQDYSNVERYIKENYSKSDQDKIFGILSKQNRENPSALCCSIGASNDACMDCTSSCATGTYYEGGEIERIADQGSSMRTFPAEKQGKGDQYSLGKTIPDTITVDGKSRPTRNSEGRLIYTTEEGIRNFWKWFGDSMVVDEQGRPRVVYHGTVQPVFNEFDLSKAGTGEGWDQSGPGFYFTTDPESAGNYARIRNEQGGAVYTVYLKVKKPLHVDFKSGFLTGIKEQFSRDQIRKIIQSAPNYRESLENFGDVSYEGEAKVLREAVDAYHSTNNIGALGNDFYQNSDKEYLKAIFDAAGYDGTVSNTGTATHWVAWFPTQIKSATGNTGAFDAENPDIRYSIREDNSSKRSDNIVTFKPKNALKAVYGIDISFFARPAGPSSPSFRITGPAVERAVSEIAAKFNVPARVVATAAELPSEIRNAAMRRQSGGDVVLGIYHGGKVWIVAEHMRSADEARKVFIHEAVGHYGLRKVMGKDFETFLDFIVNDTKYGAEIKTFAKEYGISDPREAADEWFARQAETMKQNSSLWSRFMFHVRKWLRSLGVTLEYGKPELVELLRVSREAARKGGTVEAGGTRYRGYDWDAGKSNNAVDAEASGKYPASKVAKMLGVPIEVVREFDTREYHHTGKYFNTTKYYDVDEVREWIEDNPEEVARIKAESKATVPTERSEGHTVSWLEWSGTRNNPVSERVTYENVTIEDKGGKFLTLILPGGTTVKKGRDTNGFEIDPRWYTPEYKREQDVKRMKSKLREIGKDINHYKKYADEYTVLAASKRSYHLGKTEEYLAQANKYHEWAKEKLAEQKKLREKIKAAEQSSERPVPPQSKTPEGVKGVQKDREGMITGADTDVKGNLPDGGIRYSVRRDYKPKKTIKVYRLMEVVKSKPGEFKPLFIGRSTPAAIGVWMVAENLPTKGYAPRPGFHSGAKPFAPWLMKKDGSMPDNRAWAEVEIPADVNWQEVADKNGRVDKNGNLIPYSGELKDQIPEDGYYEYEPDSNKHWYLSGAMKIIRILSADEVDQINDAGAATTEPAADIRFSTRLSPDATRSTDAVISDYKRTSAIGKALTPISTALERIHPRLKYGKNNGLRGVESRIAIRIREDTQAVLPLLQSVKKKIRDKADLKAWDLARKNSDEAGILRIVKKYGLGAEYGKYRMMEDGIFKRAREAGYSVRYLKEHWARMIRDEKGFLEYLHNTTEWGMIDEAIKAAEEKGKKLLSDREKAVIANRVLRGPTIEQVNLPTPGNVKERSIGKIDDELNKYYFDADTSVLKYIELMNKNIEARKYFGVGPKADVSPVDPLMDEQLDESIGMFVAKQRQELGLTPEKENELIAVLRARFNYRPLGGMFQHIKELGYLTAMGSGISSTITQLGDIPYAFYIAPKDAARAMMRAFKGKSPVDVYGLGIERIAEEFSDLGKLGKALRVIFKGIGLAKMDTVFKETLVNAAVAKMQRQAREGNIDEDLQYRIDAIFGSEKDAVIADLKANRISEDVKLLAFNVLCDFQPVALSEMPAEYLSGETGGKLSRLFYMMKTYTIKQMDVIRREAIWDIKRGNYARGSARFASLIATLILANMSADAIKDWIFRRRTDLSDLVVDNILKLVGISRYLTWSFRTDGIKMSIARLLLPPTDVIELPVKDVWSAGKAIKDGEEFDARELQSLRMIPVAGQMYHWWFGGGKASRIKRDRTMILKDIEQYYQKPDKARAEKLIAQMKEYNAHAPKDKKITKRTLSAIQARVKRERRTKKAK